MYIDLVKKGKIFFIISMLLIVLSLIAVFSLGLNLGIDFVGGTTLDYKFNKGVSVSSIQSTVKKALGSSATKNLSITQTSTNVYQIQTAPLSTDQLKKVETALNYGTFEGNTTIGPSIGAELTSDAIKSMALVICGIILYIAFAFRKVPKPTSSFTFGITAVLAMLHDVLMVVGVFAVLGVLFKAPIDSLFVTALLTVMGFSVHDTIVVFDRIRENLRLNRGADFSTIVNNSLMQTLGRSINTSLTVLLVLFAAFMLGGDSIRWFVLALLVGIASGTYSSIFVASQALVIWENRKKKE